MSQRSLHERIDAMLQESRMIMPGIQALFGFQLIAVFSSAFAEMPIVLQRLHVTALVATSTSIVLMLTPATYHRIRMPETEEEGFIPFGTRFIVASLVPLAAALTLDVFVILQRSLGEILISGTVAGALGASCAFLWFALPWRARRRGNV